MSIRYFVGIDEAGRGPLAGPVAVGVLCVKNVRHSMLNKSGNFASGALKDPKQMTPARREQIFRELFAARRRGELWFTTTLISHQVIDRRGIVSAVRLGIRRCLSWLNRSHNKPRGSINRDNCLVLLDGSLRAPRSYRCQRTIIRGDATEPVIMLAAVAAKVRRDRRMILLHRRYPAYGFSSHKGYGTAAHYRALARHGPSPIHRLTFLDQKSARSKKSSRGGDHAPLRSG